MVIGGFFNKKKADDSKASPSGDIPDELPPLGEESAPAAATGNNPVSAEPPDELPGLEETATPKEPEGVEHVVRTENLKRLTAEVPEHEPEPEENQEEGKSAPQELPAVSGPVSTEGFFANISKQLQSGKPIGSLISHDLLASMKENWGIRKESSKTGLTSSEEKRVTAAINDVLTQLRLMESKWRAHKMILDEYEKLSREQEEKIKGKEKELKTLLKSYKLYQHVPEDCVIMLKDSIPISSLSEAINALRTMDSPGFNVHVNVRKNDFSRLAACIDRKLGADLKSAKTKGEMLRILELFVRKLFE